MAIDLSTMSFGCLAILLLVAISNVEGRDTPIVMLPSVVSWDEKNQFVITPFRSFRPVDITVTLTGPGVEDTVTDLRGQLSGRPVVVELVPNGRAPFYNVSIEVTGHGRFESTMMGSTALKEVIVQTDKMIYKPSEEVRVRSLPITKDGLIYEGEVQYHLENPNGFRIMKKLEKSTGRFVAFNFTLPTFGKFGRWKIVAISEKSNQVLGSTTIQVKEYVLSKFLVSLEAKPSGNKDRPVTVFVGAKLAHGKPMDGNVVLKCTRAGDINVHSHTQTKIMAATVGFCT
ncbi:unnamed protein product [Bursaphelenchus okinawaensis]|uniref:MG2 domain-containing protein n=1 Tax=Bursaphelenchus okinawaensis TaxID=465554 RepID=A0A811LMX4_9BILA|nr:unnamed protein product [Bursaphelenchus okinawaensis]CAG9127091.1 unnamed protein product [Bursaphelenchus okinawaensis]